MKRGALLHILLIGATASCADGDEPRVPPSPQPGARAVATIDVHRSSGRRRVALELLAAEPDADEHASAAVPTVVRREDHDFVAANMAQWLASDG